MKKRFWAVTMIISIVLFSVTCYAAAPTLVGFIQPHNWVPESGIFYLQGCSLPVTVSYSGTAPTAPFVSWNAVRQNTLTVDTSYNLITGTFTPDSSDYLPGIFNGSAIYSSPANLTVTAANSDGISTISRAGYVTGYPLSGYLYIDPSFSYTDEYTNYFLAIGTPPSNSNQRKYNCLSYVIDVYDTWTWPWGQNNPSQTQVVNFMLGYDNGQENGTPRTIGTIYDSFAGRWVAYETKVIYYEGGHFAKVVSYNSDGSPKRIASKWGSLELILSTDYDPFSEATYGSPIYYFQ